MIELVAELELVLKFDLPQPEGHRVDLEEGMISAYPNMLIRLI